MAKIHLIGNAHLDPVWLWRWQEGCSEVLATFRSALDRIKEFDGFIFTCAGAVYYRWVEETDPLMFGEIKQRVAEGRWVIVGGQMIQPDCNAPCGESFARHALYSQNYYKEKFGVTARVGYNVDSFGHCAMLPQILKNSGLQAYVFMRPGPHELELPFPDRSFIWVSPDGTKIPVFRVIEPYTSGAFGESAEKAKNHMETAEKIGAEQLMCFYGVGNHGGGPTIQNILALRKLQSGTDGEDYVFSSPDRFFAELDTSKLPEYKGDLHHHASGCYSAVMKIKSLNRISESHLINAEKAGVTARLAGVLDKVVSMKDAWRPTLFNHFHDIAGGCCIKSAASDAEVFFGKSIYEADSVMNRALQRIAWNIDTSKGNPVILNKTDFKLWENDGKGTPIVVFNMNSFAVRTPVRLGCLVGSVEDDDGNVIPCQSARAEMTDGTNRLETEITAELPPMGWKLYWGFKDKKSPGKRADVSDAYTLENEWLRVSVDRDGFIGEIYDKKAKRKLCGRVKPVVIDESKCDTWAHGVFTFGDVCGEFGKARIINAERGEIREQLTISYTYGNSGLTLDINLYDALPAVYINCKVNWQEKHKMLKLVFPTELENAKDVASVPFGFSVRNADGKEQPMQKWVALKDGDHGLGIATDTRSAYDVASGELRLTVVRSPAYADHYGERDGLMQYTDQGEQSFRVALTPVDRDLTALYRLGESLLNTPMTILGTYHKGKLGAEGSVLDIGSENVAATAFKPAEDGKGYILRCHETGGTPVVTRICIPALNVCFEAEFGAQQIRTFRIYDGKVTETDFTES